MNKARLLLLILLLATLSGSVCMHPATLRVVEIPDAKWRVVPAGYYNHAPVIPAGVDPYEWLDNLEWAAGYERNQWDCSKMAAYLEWALENAGIPAWICAGHGHAWLKVYRADEGGEVWAYEPVELHWVHPWAEGRYYHPTFWWDDIYELEQWYGRRRHRFAVEWCWWADVGVLIADWEG